VSNENLNISNAFKCVLDKIVKLVYNNVLSRKKWDIMGRATRFEDWFRHRIDGPYCVYCGDFFSEMDHYPPATETRQGVLIPSCNECNSILSNLRFERFEDRVKYVKKKLKSRYKKALETPEWSEEELSELGQSLREAAVLWREQQRFIRKRVAWDAETYLRSIDTGNDFAQANAEMTSIILKEKERMRRAKLSNV